MSDGSGETADPAHTSERRRHPGAVEKLADLFVFAPIGVLSEAGRLWPEVVAAGREHVEGAMALRSEAVSQSREWIATRTGRGGHDTPTTVHRPAPSAPSDQADEAGVAGGRAPVGTTGRPAERENAVPAQDPNLAIPDYDLLSASQVVPRLDALAADELEDVRRHEETNRSRRTILSKIAQLQTG